MPRAGSRALSTAWTKPSRKQSKAQRLRIKKLSANGCSAKTQYAKKRHEARRSSNLIADEEVEEEVEVDIVDAANEATEIVAEPQNQHPVSDVPNTVGSAAWQRLRDMGTHVSQLDVRGRMGHWNMAAAMAYASDLKAAEAAGVSPEWYGHWHGVPGAAGSRYLRRRAKNRGLPLGDYEYPPACPPGAKSRFWNNAATVDAANRGSSLVADDGKEIEEEVEVDEVDEVGVADGAAEVVVNVGDIVWYMGHEDWIQASVAKVNQKSFRVEGVREVLMLADHGDTWVSTAPDGLDEVEVIEPATAEMDEDPLPERRAAAARDDEVERGGVVCTDEWERFELRCVLSFQRLTDPAKGSACRHRACCNYQVLRDYVGRCATGPKVCPLATCNAQLQRTRDVERDDALRERVDDVPPEVSIVWLRGDETRTSQPRPRPPPSAGSSVAHASTQKRVQRDEPTQISEKKAKRSTALPRKKQYKKKAQLQTQKGRRQKRNHMQRVRVEKMEAAAAAGWIDPNPASQMSWETLRGLGVFRADEAETVARIAAEKNEAVVDASTVPIMVKATPKRKKSADTKYREKMLYQREHTRANRKAKLLFADSSGTGSNLLPNWVLQDMSWAEHQRRSRQMHQSD